MTIEKDTHFADPSEPLTFINLFEMDEADIDQFVADWSSVQRLWVSSRVSSMPTC